MDTSELAPALARIFRELVSGANHPRGSFVLNSGDPGLLASLDALPAADASGAVSGGASVAAHAQHLRHGLSLMNRWAREGGNPFADATWDAAWRTTGVDESMWREIRDGLRDEAAEWLAVLAAPREVSPLELCGVISSIAHVSYHMGAIRQVAVATRGPRQGTFAPHSSASEAREDAAN